ncbi:FMN-dependent NADH-azoreductase [Novosphingobium sp. Gsoil 351]|uniref:FMN-dependent NADH-azoreductase n=1 Tax=Novosphingobium sp. Gsoil 351 TaxID=2675225 RepID=UPI0012B4ED32|nr:NAD(P)H-dependent oxidoreductase [Novosphingobium sp. Gsoil 351]QGN56029.1 FMN-dependent NADH-azoreductase [Novosphingobium sp. Gsoil 351]
MTILHIDSSITGDSSVSRQVSKAIVDSVAAVSGGVVIHRDLAADPLPHLTLPALAEREAVDEFLAADTIVIGAPMYNFTVPTQLKAWIDRILLAGVTFRYTATGPEGLAGGRRVIVALSRGGLYGAGSPAAGLEHVESYLRAAFGFIGIVPEFVLAEGIALGAEQREQALAGATEAALKLAA